MILMKACPRCRGDMMQQELLGEVEIVCLQCRFRTYPEMIGRHQPHTRAGISRKAA